MALNCSVGFVFELIVGFAGFQVVKDLFNGLSTKDINAEKVVRFAESVVLRKVGRDGSKTLAIARFDPFEELHRRVTPEREEQRERAKETKKSEGNRKNWMSSLCLVNIEPTN